MKRSKLSLGLLLIGGLALAGCSSNQKTSDVSTSTSIQSSTEEKEINYTLKVYDLDGTELLNKSLKTKKKDSLFVDLNRESTLESDASDTGHFLESINGSIKDDNYYLAIYQNGKYSQVGIDDIVLSDNDEIVIKNECWNTVGNGYGGTMTETDILVDKIIYSSYKKFSDIYIDSTYIPYDAIFAYSALEKKENSVVDSKKIFPDAIKANYETIDYTTLDLNSTFKTAITLYALEKDLTGIKEHITNSSFDLTQPYSETSAVYTYDVMKLLNVSASNIADYNTLIDGLTLGGDETSCMYVSALAGKENYDFTSFKASIKEGITENGFSYTSNWGGYDYTTCNASSTSQAILALTELGVDLNSDEYKANDKSLIDALLKYYDNEKGLFFDYEGDTYNLSYAEPQALAALISYKILRDKGSVNIYRG